MIVSVFVSLCLPPKHFRTKIGKVRSAAWEILCIMWWRELCHRLKTRKSRSYLPTAHPLGWSKSRWCALGLDKPRLQGRWQCRREWTSCAKSGKLCSCPFKKMLRIAEVVGYLGYLPVLFGFRAFHQVLVRSVLWLIALARGKRAQWAPFSLSQLNSRIWWEKHLKQHKAAALAQGAQRPSRATAPKHRVGSRGARALLPACGIRTGMRAHVARPNEIGFQTLLLTFKTMKLSSRSY